MTASMLGHQGPHFTTDLAEASPLAPGEISSHITELLGMRPALEKSVREVFKLKQELDESVQSHRRSELKLLQSMVGTADELSRLLVDARRALAPQPAPGLPSEAVARQGILARLWSPRKPKAHTAPEGRAGAKELDIAPGSSSSHDWLSTFERLAAAATNQLETLGVQRVLLVGQDLRDLKFEAQFVKNWVAIKKRSQEQSLVVIEEFRGLWVSRIDKELFPVQRGEVSV